MFTCAKIRDGGTYLGNHLTANDYYCENESVVGRWVGKAAAELGIEGQPIRKGDTAFEALRRSGILCINFRSENYKNFQRKMQ
jgi:hypothetical protein